MPTRSSFRRYPSVSSGVHRRAKTASHLGRGQHQWTPGHVCGRNFHSWGSSGRRFKSCQPDAAWWLNQRVARACLGEPEVCMAAFWDVLDLVLLLVSTTLLVLAVVLGVALSLGRRVTGSSAVTISPLTVPTAVSASDFSLGYSRLGWALRKSCQPDTVSPTQVRGVFPSTGRRLAPRPTLRGGSARQLNFSFSISALQMCRPMSSSPHLGHRFGLACCSW
jgi:hypothetical protein